MPSNKINPKEFLTSYLNDFSDLVEPDEKIMSGHNYWDIYPVVGEQKGSFLSGPDHIVLT